MKSDDPEYPHHSFVHGHPVRVKNPANQHYGRSGLVRDHNETKVWVRFSGHDEKGDWFLPNELTPTT